MVSQLKSNLATSKSRINFDKVQKLKGKSWIVININAKRIQIKE